MKIARILNNNVVIVKNNNEEVIYAGKGLGFNKSVGDLLDESKVEKVFRATDSDVNKKLQLLLGEIPIEIISLTQKIVNEISLKGIEVSDSIFLSLSDHINSAIENHVNDYYLPNTLLIDIKNFYPIEFELGLKALELIEEEQDVKLEVDEAGFLAMHIVNAQTNNDLSNDIFQITKLIHSIVNIVKIHFKMDIDTESLYYYRFITHLKYFCKRMLDGNEVIPSSSDIEILFDTAKERFEKSYKCVIKISEFLSKTQNYNISNEEIFYLTVHIERVINSTNT